MLAAPAVAAGVFAMTILLALPLAITMRGALAAHLGESLAAETAATGINYDWWQEFTAQATGLGTTFSPSIIGFAAVLDNISGVLDARARVAPIAAALALYLAGWAFLSGGILDRYARQRRIHAHGFFAAAGGYGFRFVRLAAIAGLVYWWLFAYVHPWLLTTQFENLTRGMNVERSAFLVRLILYAVFGVLLVATNLVIDYTKVRIVVEDRHSVLGAITASIRFIRNHPRRVLALYGLNSASFLALLAVWCDSCAGSWWRGPRDVGRVHRRADLHRRAAAAEIAVHRVRDCTLPVEPRARLVHGRARAGVAGLARRRGHPLEHVSAIANQPGRPVRW